MNPEELQRRVDSFERWHYRIDLGDGVVTPCGNSGANRAIQRRHVFFDRLLELTGSLKGMRVLDLGCNAGYWSLCAIEAGADFVFGIDGREMHVNQSNLVFEAKGVDPSRYRFELGNFLTYPFEQFDLVLCLGVLYHVASPVDLFNAMADTKADLWVVDTSLSHLEGNAFTLFTEPIESARNATEESVVLYPTRGAVEMLANQHGYQSIELDNASVTDWFGMGGYEDGKRAAFIASKTRDLGSLPKAAPRPRPSLLKRLRAAV